MHAMVKMQANNISKSLVKSLDFKYQSKFMAGGEEKIGGYTRIRQS
jgi:hypothetical protein